MNLRVTGPWLRLPRVRFAGPSQCRVARRTFSTPARDFQAQHDDDTLAQTADEPDDYTYDATKDERVDDYHDAGESSIPDLQRKKAHWVDPGIMRAAKRELPWLMADSASFSRRIQVALQNGQEELAVAIVRLASKKKDEAVVAWNILIKHAFSGTELLQHNKALRFYNEMKKRNQTPDATTYGTLLSGLNQHPRPEAIVDEAFNAYRLMQRDDSKTKPNIRHYNMLISIFGRAKDMEKFWSVVQAIPESGPDVAVPATYVSMLEALRLAQAEPQGADPVIAKDPDASTTIDDAAFAIWGAAVDAWGKGTLEMTVEVVSAMARFLNSSQNLQNSHLVFALIEQTTGIPKAQKYRIRKNGVLSESDAPFTPLVDKPYAVFVQPTNHILMGLLEASQRLSLKKRAEYYWNIFTGPSGYNITPDVAALKQYLRVLRVTKSSQDAVKEVLDWRMPIELDEGVYRIAMSTCRRNAWRAGVLSHATELYAFRKRWMAEPFMPVLEQFIQTIDISLLEPRSTHDTRIKALELISDDLEALLSRENCGWTGPSGTASQDFVGRSIDSAKMVIGIIDYMANGAVDVSRFSNLKSKLAEFVREQYSAAPRHSSSVLFSFLDKNSVKRGKFYQTEKWRSPGRSTDQDGSTAQLF